MLLLKSTSQKRASVIIPALFPMSTFIVGGLYLMGFWKVKFTWHKLSLSVVYLFSCVQTKIFLEAADSFSFQKS